MNEFEFTFAQAPWELAVEKLKAGDSLSAMRLLTLLEGEDEQALEDAFEALESRGVTLDVTELPVDWGSGATGARLRQEAMIAEKGFRWEGLEENDPLRLYLQELASTPAAGDPQFLADRFASGEEAAGEMLVNVSMSAVLQEAALMTGRGVLLLDLIQEGSLGLWQGILNYESGDFISQSRWWIRQYMAKAVTAQARNSGVGRKMRDLLEEYRAADKRLLTELGRNPVIEEIALELNLSVEDALQVEQMVISAQTLEKAKKAAQPKEESPEDDQAVEDTAYFRSRQRILDMLSGLDKADAEILTLRFGLEGGLPLSPQEVGKKLNLTAEEVVSREAAALAKLRNEG